MKMFQYWATPTPLPEKDEASVRYMHYNHVVGERKGVGIPVVFDMATETEQKNGKHQIHCTHKTLYKRR